MIKCLVTFNDIAMTSFRSNFEMYSKLAKTVTFLRFQAFKEATSSENI